jgi:hypothetical protein
VLNKNTTIPDSVRYVFSGDGQLESDERLINFTDSPKEVYLILLASTPCQIYYVYNRKYSIEKIGNINELPSGEIDRIRKRFYSVVLKKALDYKIMHNIADSIAFMPNGPGATP